MIIKVHKLFLYLEYVFENHANASEEQFQQFNQVQKSVQSSPDTRADGLYV